PLLRPSAAWSAPGPNGNLNLASTAHSMPAGSLAGFQPVVVNNGGHALSITSTSHVTPAEALAVMQLLTTGRQSIVLNAGGAAAGGSVSLTGANSAASTMVIPRGVTVLDNLATSNNALSIAGNLSNAGSLYISGNAGTLS